MTSTERDLCAEELSGCTAEDGVRCPDRTGWWPHICDHEPNHPGPHECSCGHHWTNPPDEERDR